MSKKHNYEVVVGNVGTMPYTNKKLAMDCYKTYVTLSKNRETRAANEPVTLLKDGEILEEYIPNLIANMFDIAKVKELIAKCPKDEVVILCAHWSINGPKYDDDSNENQDWDWNEFEQELGTTLMVNDYDDLIADVHGIMSF